MDLRNRIENKLNKFHEKCKENNIRMEIEVDRQLYEGGDATQHISIKLKKEL